jgi:hypothetical protein
MGSVFIRISKYSANDQSHIALEAIIVSPNEANVREKKTSQTL